MRSMTNTRADERAGKCDPADEPGCDRDPRRSTPLHLATGKKLGAGAADRHAERRRLRRRAHPREPRHASTAAARGAGFWEIATASHVDYPQQSRTIEIMDNRDGTLSLFGTILDSAAPAAAPAPGSALGFTSAQLASLGRTLSFNDPQRDADEDDPPREGRRADRNVELLVQGPALAERTQGPAHVAGPAGPQRGARGVGAARAVHAAARVRGRRGEEQAAARRCPRGRGPGTGAGRAAGAAGRCRR